MNKRADGEYRLTIPRGSMRGHKQVNIYCHGMNTHHPTEYLTVPQAFNYARFDSQRYVIFSF